MTMTTDSAEGQTFRELIDFVLHRDNYQCRACGAGGENTVHVHHWKYKSRGGDDVASNLITLCFRCHDRIHNDPTILAVVVDDTGYPHVFVRRK